MKNYLWIGLAVLSLSMLVSAQYFQPIVLQGDGSSSYNITVCSTDARCGDVVWEEFAGSGTTVQNFYIEKPYVACFNVPFWYTAYNGSNEVIQDSVKSRLFGNMWCGNISLGEGGESYTNIGSYLRIPWFDSCAYLNTDTDGVFMCQPTFPIYNDLRLNTSINNIFTNLSNINSSVAKWDNNVGTVYDDGRLNLSVNNIFANLTLINASVSRWDNFVSGGTADDVYLNITALQDNVTLLNESVAKWDSAPLVYATIVNLNTLVTNLSNINASVAVWDSIVEYGDWRTPVNNVVTNLTNINDSVAKWDAQASYGDWHTVVNNLYTNLSNINNSVANWDLATNNGTITQDAVYQLNEWTANVCNSSSVTCLVNNGFPNGGITLTSGNLWVSGNIYVLGNISNTQVIAVSINGSMNPTIDNTFDVGTPVLRWRKVIGVSINATDNLYIAGVDVQTMINNIHSNLSSINGSVAKWDAAFGWGNWATSINNLFTNLSNVNASVAKWDGYSASINTLTTNATTAHTELDAVRTNLTNINASVWKWDIAANNVSSLLVSLNNAVTNLTNINGSVATWNLAAANSTSRVTAVSGTAPVVSSGGATPAISLILLKDLNPVTNSGIVCSGNDILPGADADVNIGIDSSIITNWTGASSRFMNQTLGYSMQVAVGTASFDGKTGSLNMSGNATSTSTNFLIKSGGNVIIQMGP